MSGFPDTAERRATEAVALAERLGHPYSLAYAVFHAGLLDLWSGRIDSAGERARRVVRIAIEREYAVWHASGLIVEGVTVAALGRPDEGLEADRPRVSDCTRPFARRPSSGRRSSASGHRPSRLPAAWHEALDVVAEAMRVAGPDDICDLIPLLISQADMHLAAVILGRRKRLLPMPWPRHARSRRGRAELMAALRLAHLDGESPERHAAVQAAVRHLHRGLRYPGPPGCPRPDERDGDVDFLTGSPRRSRSTAPATSSYSSSRPSWDRGARGLGPGKDRWVPVMPAATRGLGPRCGCRRDPRREHP